MVYNFLLNHHGDVLVIELELMKDNLDIERAIRDAAIEHCLATGVCYWEKGIGYYKFFTNASEAICRENGFVVKRIRKLADAVNEEKIIVFREELIVHDAWKDEKKSRKWDILSTALTLSKMCGAVKKLRAVNELELLEWGAEFVNEKRTDLNEFFREKIKGLKQQNKEEASYGTIVYSQRLNATWS